MKIEEILSGLGIPYREGGEHKNVRNGFVGIDCPYCGGSEKYLLGINTRTGFTSCWRCGKHPLLMTLHQVSGKSYGELKALLDLAKKSWSEARIEPRRGSGKLILPDGLQELPGPHRAYLKSRGYDPDQLIRLWGLKGIGMASRLAWRIWIPIYQRKRMVCWTTRAISDEVEPKYQSASPEESILTVREVLYGEEYCSQAIIVVEGPADAWRVGPGAAATLGVNLSDMQISRILRYPLRAICFDSDAAGQRRAQKLMDDLSVMEKDGETINIQLDAEDPGSASSQEIANLRRAVLG